MSETTTTIPGWYLKLQTAVLEQLPRPGAIIKERALYWLKNQGHLHQVLMSALTSDIGRSTWKRQLVGVFKGFLPVPSQTNVSEFVEELETRWKISPEAKRILLVDEQKVFASSSFNLFALGTSYFPEGKKVTIKEMIVKANEYQCKRPSIALTCLIRDRFLDQENQQLGTLIVAHDPVPESVKGRQCLLSISNGGIDVFILHSREETEIPIGCSLVFVR